MRAGQLRREVVLQSLGTRVDDGFGGGSIVDTDVATVWAAIEPLTGDEILRAGQLEANLTHRVRIRYLATPPRPHWKVKYGTRVFDIKTIADLDERHREIELMCEELVTW